MDLETTDRTLLFWVSWSMLEGDAWDIEEMKAAVIGSGLIAQARRILALLWMKKEVDLVAMCDKNEELAKKTVVQFGIGKAYNSTSDSFSKEKLDFVDICAPPQVHADVAIESVQNGCHVMMEKPMVLETSDCDRMLDTSKQLGAKTCVMRNNPAGKSVIATRPTGLVKEFEEDNGVLYLTNRKEC